MKVEVTFTKEELAEHLGRLAANTIGAQAFSAPALVQFKLDHKNEVAEVTVMLTEVERTP